MPQNDLKGTTECEETTLLIPFKNRLKAPHCQEVSKSTSFGLAFIQCSSMCGHWIKYNEIECRVAFKTTWNRKSYTQQPLDHKRWQQQQHLNESQALPKQTYTTGCGFWHALNGGQPTGILRLGVASYRACGESLQVAGKAGKTSCSSSAAKHVIPSTVPSRVTLDHFPTNHITA